MSLNRTLRDFVVKSASVDIKTGSSWQKTLDVAQPGKQYRLGVVCGNKDGQISWGTEGDYNKVLLEIRVVAQGFKVFSAPAVGQNQIEFYTNSSFSQVVSGSAKYRTKFNLPEYAPTHADSLTYLYFKFKTNTPAVPLYWLQWSFGIYGAVRNHHWKTRYTR